MDGHVFEPDELWEQYLTTRYHERRPRLITDERGTTRYLVEGRAIPPATGPGAWAPEGIRESTTHRPGGLDASQRLTDMNTEGIDVAVLYGAMSLGLYAGTDKDLTVACCQAYNNWLADWCSADPERLRGTPSLPLKWMPEAVAEAERCVTELGFVSLTVPCAVGERNPDHPDNHPLYDLAEQLDVPLGFHAGGCRFAHSRFSDAYAQLHVLEFPFNLMFAATTLLCGGVLERFRRLRVALLEGGAGWLPHLMERLDEHYEYRTAEFGAITRPPREYFAEGRMMVSTEGEHGLGHVVAQVGVDCIVWASDYPHWDSDFPDSVTQMTDRNDLAPDAIRAILETNPKRLFAWS